MRHRAVELCQSSSHAACARAAYAATCPAAPGQQSVEDAETGSGAWVRRGRSGVNEASQRCYLTPRPGAKRAQKATSGPRGGIRKGGKDKPSACTTEIRSKLEKKLKEVRDHAKEVQPGQQRTNHTAPHRVARAQQEREHASSMPSMGSSAVDGLEAQIGGLSMQYHNLLLLLAGATGRRATKLQAQIIALQQKLTALNLELEKRKLKEAKDKDPKSQI